MRTQSTITLEEIASLENLLGAWQEFINGKRSKTDVQHFSLHLMDNICLLRQELLSHSYRHGPYQPFNICDPKPRNIHKAMVRDRLLHHALYRQLYPFFNRTFIGHSYSCRNNKGTHKALNCFRAFAYKASMNHTRTAWVLKCDIRKFFASIDHSVLVGLLERYVPDAEVIQLLREIVGSFSSTAPGVGLPLGNLTSQLFVNIYMNEFDQFMKHTLRAKYYLRYADDFAIISPNRPSLEEMIPQVNNFLRDKLKLTLHPNKVSITSFASGVDFLGWIHFPDHRVIRTATKRRMLRNLQRRPQEKAVASYSGMLQHGNAQKQRERLAGMFPFWFEQEPVDW